MNLEIKSEYFLLFKKKYIFSDSNETKNDKLTTSKTFLIQSGWNC